MTPRRADEVDPATLTRELLAGVPACPTCETAPRVCCACGGLADRGRGTGRFPYEPDPVTVARGSVGGQVQDPPPMHLYCLACHRRLMAAAARILDDNAHRMRMGDFSPLIPTRG